MEATSISGRLVREFSNTVRWLLYNCDQPQYRLANALNIHRSQLSRRMNGQSVWTLPELIKVAAFFGMELSDLISAAERTVRKSLTTSQS